MTMQSRRIVTDAVSRPLFEVVKTVSWFGGFDSLELRSYFFLAVISVGGFDEVDFSEFALQEAWVEVFLFQS